MKGNSWVVVANKEEAKIYKIKKVGQFEEVASFIHPDAGKKGTDYYSDRPTRAFDRVGAGRHSMEPETTLEEKKCTVFAHLLGDFLRGCSQRGDFQYLYVAAEPRFLGFIRKLWPKELSDRIEETVSKDIVKATPQEIWNHLQITV